MTENFPVVVTTWKSRCYTQRINICIYNYLNSLIIQLNPRITRITFTIALKRNLFKKNFQQSYRRCLYMHPNLAPLSESTISLKRQKDTYCCRDGPVKRQSAMKQYLRRFPIQAHRGDAQPKVRLRISRCWAL